MNRFRKLIGRLTSPIFVPFRRFIVWSDTRFGTCHMKLSLEPRWDHSLDGFADIGESSEGIVGGEE